MFGGRQRWCVMTTCLKHGGAGSAFFLAQPSFCGGEAAAPFLGFEPLLTSICRFLERMHTTPPSILYPTLISHKQLLLAGRALGCAQCPPALCPGRTGAISAVQQLLSCLHSLASHSGSAGTDRALWGFFSQSRNFSSPTYCGGGGCPVAA